MHKLSLMTQKEIAFLKREMVVLKIELRFLRRGQPQGDENSLETLLAYLHDAFGDQSWPAAQVFELAAEHPLIRGVIVRCIGSRPTIQRFSKFLMRSLGAWGDFQLICIRSHSQVGALYSVTECITPSGRNSANVRAKKEWDRI